MKIVGLWLAVPVCSDLEVMLQMFFFTGFEGGHKSIRVTNEFEIVAKFFDLVNYGDFISCFHNSKYWFKNFMQVTSVSSWGSQGGTGILD